MQIKQTPTTSLKKEQSFQPLSPEGFSLPRNSTAVQNEKLIPSDDRIRQ
jgi:hypothetical protein